MNYKHLLLIFFLIQTFGCQSFLRSSKSPFFKINPKELENDVIVFTGYSKTTKFYKTENKKLIGPISGLINNQFYQFGDDFQLTDTIRLIGTQSYHDIHINDNFDYFVVAKAYISKVREVQIYDPIHVIIKTERNEKIFNKEVEWWTTYVQKNQKYN